MARLALTAEIRQRIEMTSRAGSSRAHYNTPLEHMDAFRNEDSGLHGEEEQSSSAQSNSQESSEDSDPDAEEEAADGADDQCSHEEGHESSSSPAGPEGQCSNNPQSGCEPDDPEADASAPSLFVDPQTFRVWYLPPTGLPYWTESWKAFEDPESGKLWVWNKHTSVWAWL